MDRRLTPANANAALDSLRGIVDAPHFTAGERATVKQGTADLLRAPGGARDRQLLWGDAVTVIDRAGGWAFLQAAKDGYCGYLPENTLAIAPQPATHWVATPGTHLYSGPKVQHLEITVLPLGARLQVVGYSDDWAETPEGFVPLMHLRALGDWFADPATVAQGLLHSPYLWGGNSRAGIDCSGLAQIAFHACGHPLPGDSDLQARTGQPIPEGAPLRRNDLLFWKGHVALVLSPDRMIHATAAAMAVIEEEIPTAIARIAASGGGPVTHRRRILA